MAQVLQHLTKWHSLAYSRTICYSLSPLHLLHVFGFYHRLLYVYFCYGLLFAYTFVTYGVEAWGQSRGKDTFGVWHWHITPRMGCLGSQGPGWLTISQRVGMLHCIDLEA